MYTKDTAPGQAGCRLLEPDEPPPVSILNETGSAQVLLVGDHVSNRIPRALDSLGLATPVLGEHVAYDIGTRKLITHLSQHLDAPAVLAGYSRLVMDMNRSLEDPSVIPEVSDGIPIPGNRGLSHAQRAQRLHCFYTPYRTAIDDMLHRIRARGVVPAFISIHSFTPQLAADRRHRPWQIGLMWDKDPRIPVPLLERLRARPENLTVGDNEPYSGKHVADYTIDHHAEAAGLPHISIETRQDLVNTEDGAERWAVILWESLRDILADPDLYTLWEN
jgi:predicted N-formylglutamate amidohydrolase